MISAEPGGSIKPKMKTIGKVGEYPKLADVKQAVSNLGVKINAPSILGATITVVGVWRHS
jgi:hypothetical protein